MAEVFSAEVVSEAIGISEAELDVTLSGPAVLVNKVYATALPSGLRLTFCENRGDATTNQFRSAVLLPYSDVPEVIKLLKRLMERIEFEFRVKPPPETDEEEGG